MDDILNLITLPEDSRLLFTLHPFPPGTEFYGVRTGQNPGVYLSA
jgi:hypothetical protein